MALSDASIYVVRKGRQFLCGFLNCMKSLEEAEGVLARILEPFLPMTVDPEHSSESVSSSYFPILFLN